MSCKHSVWCLLVLSALLMQVAQARSFDLNIQNLGIRIPSPIVAPQSAPRSVEMAPAWSPQSTPGILPGLSAAPSLTPLPAGGVPRLVLDPIVAKDSLGFYNNSDQALGFKLQMGASARIITLQAREILTIKISEPAGEIRGTIGTGTSDSSSILSGGEIYVLRADSGRWVFAKF